MLDFFSVDMCWSMKKLVICFVEVAKLWLIKRQSYGLSHSTAFYLRAIKFSVLTD